MVTLRCGPGTTVYAFDGEGREWSAEVERVERSRVELVLREDQTFPVEPPLRSLVLQAVSLDSIFEESVDQMTALGVSVIVPLLVERSKTPRRPPDEKRLERWRRIAREASKLSWRRVVPVIERPVTLGPVRGAETVIQTGVKPGETVVTDGQLRLVPGSKVNAKSREAAPQGKPAEGRGS